MDRTVVMLMTGAAHVPYMLVCLKTLRQHYDGRIIVYATQDDTAALTQPICNAVDAELRRCNLVNVPKNQQFTTKVAMFARGEFPSGVCCYLDADLIIKGSIDELFERAGRSGFCATQFCDWTTGGGIIANRLKRTAEYGVSQNMIDATIAGIHPSPNGGVFAAVPSLPRLHHWLALTKQIIGGFIADEVALNLLLHRWQEDGHADIITGGSFNCSPKHRPESLSEIDVVIWHGHGDSFARAEKHGVDLWLPLFNECMAENFGGCTEWEDWTCGNKFLRRLDGITFTI